MSIDMDSWRLKARLKKGTDHKLFFYIIIFFCKSYFDKITQDMNNMNSPTFELQSVF